MVPEEEFRYQLRQLNLDIKVLESKVSELTFNQKQILQELTTLVPLMEKLDREHDLEQKIADSFKIRDTRLWTKRDRFIAICVAFIAVSAFMEQSYSLLIK